jgi:putative FmdB family regulatory protein
MPTYEYDCRQCGGFDALRSIARRNDPAVCPGCGTASARVLVSAPHLARLDAATRTALTTNERAAHAPRSSRDGAAGYQRLKHPAGCGCCATGIRSATVRAPSGAKSFPGKRPWMISH